MTSTPTSRLEACLGCGQLVGTGSLLDFQPNVPPGALEVGLPLKDWRRFASRYRCPLCARYAPHTPTQEDVA